MKLLKSRKGFTLIELLVVIGILAVLAAIAIPSVAGLIDRANVSSDKTNANEMTNAIERFASEYELYCQDIASGAVAVGNMDSTQGRVYNVIGVTDRAGITALEVAQGATVDENDIAIYRDTKYPANAKTARLIVENYTKTSSSTFEPKQSDMHYWYSPDCGVVVFAEPNADQDKENKLNNQIISGMDAKGNNLDDDTQWIDLTIASYNAGGAGGAGGAGDEALDISTVSSVLAENDWATIKKVIEAGKVTEVGWNVGDRSPSFTINDKSNMYAILVDVNDTNATFMLANAIGYEEINHENDGDYEAGKSSGGFAASAMKVWLEDVYKNKLDADLKTVISSASVPCAGGPDAPRTTTNASCHLFLPSVIEMNQHELLFMWGYYPYEAEIRSEGTPFDFFVNGGEIEDDEGIWTRTPSCITGEGYFFNSLYGSNDIGCAYENLAVCPAFVIGQ